MRYYIASPGFNLDQLDKIHKVEDLLQKKVNSNNEFSFFSPFTHGGKLELTGDPNLDKLSVQLLFDENIKEIDKADKLIGIVDDFDKGTAFEIGYMIGKCNCDLGSINKGILLIGKLSNLMSEMISQALKKFNTLINSSQARFTVIDISTKTMEDYILFGICYAYDILVVTWANKPLESNLMSACATLCHYQWDNNQNKLTRDQLFYKLFNEVDAWVTIFGTSLYQLSNMKFKSKIE